MNDAYQKNVARAEITVADIRFSTRLAAGIVLYEITARILGRDRL
jgi:hypothetical protein